MDLLTLKPLAGHTSPETAYVVDDYPYGFRLRCKIRYWLEYKAKQGFRLCSQTTNPKLSYEKWNAPKKSTYAALGIMGLDSENHVTWTGVNIYQLQEIEAFTSVYGASFDDTQRKVADAITAAVKRYNERKAQQTKEVTS